MSNTTTATTTTTTTKWWWNKKSNTSKKSTTATKQKSVASSLNGADEDASMFSLYSYGGESLYCPSSVRISSSIRAQHTKSEYSGNYSDVESNASILSKPWISRNMIENKSIKEDDTVEQHDEDAEEDTSVLSDDEEEQYSYSIPINNTSTDNLDSPVIQSLSSIQAINPKRRGSLVDYIVNKPLQGKLKAGFGRLVGRSHSNIHHEEPASSIRRRSYG